MTVIGNKFKTDEVKNIFTDKVVEFWNLLPQEVVGSR